MPPSRRSGPESIKPFMAMRPPRARPILCAVAGVVALLLFAGCSGPAEKTASPPTPPPSTSASLTPAASPSPNVASTGKSLPLPKGALPTGKPTAGANPNRNCTAVRYQSEASGQPGGTYFQAELSPRSTWGRKCPLFDPGEECTLRWSGAYSFPGAEIYIEFQAWIPRTNRPYVTALLGPFQGGAQNFDGWRFPFKVPDQEAILFRAVLKDEDRLEVATSDSWVFWVGCTRKQG